MNLDVFISYSRRNLSFVEELSKSLELSGKNVWFDQIRQPLQGIPPGSKWWDEIKHGIESAENFLFVISKDSVASPYCQAEISHAFFFNKRIVTAIYCANQSTPEVLRTVDQAIENIPINASLPSTVSATETNIRSLTRRNWLDISQVQFVVFSDTLPHKSSLDQLLQALDLDLDRVRARSQLRQATQLWLDSGYKPAYLWPEERLRTIRAMIGDATPDLSKMEREFLRSEQDRLLEELTDFKTTHHRRMAIGERLALIGDARPGIGLRPNGLPDIVWCSVAPGQVALIKDPITFETSKHKIRAFYIAKYPVTYLQFQAFIDDPDGYKNNKWWHDLVERPALPANQRTQFANNPRDSVSWCECVAFSRWLNFNLPPHTWPEQKRKGNWEIRLPTEWEWQQATTGGNPKRIYSWGDEFFENGNTWEAGLNRAIAVGMYPEAKAECGALDMNGNVYEWCLNLFDSRTVNMRGSRRRVLRGGSFLRHREDATNFERIGEKPDLTWDIKFGFRVACAPHQNPIS